MLSWVCCLTEETEWSDNSIPYAKIGFNRPKSVPWSTLADLGIVGGHRDIQRTVLRANGSIRAVGKREFYLLNRIAEHNLVKKLAIGTPKWTRLIFYEFKNC